MEEPKNEGAYETEEMSRIGKIGFGLAFVPWLIILMLVALKPG